MQAFKTHTDGSYLCNADTKTDLKGGITLETWNLQYAAYQTDISDFSQDDVTDCDADALIGFTAEMIVGTILAAVVDFALLVYMLSRRRSKIGYIQL
ncbi:hypothetical protein MAR_013221 [Mya arenaria]|uniref:Uncharacterized protein n=2 Tax=Mya arenaria TaxID=6604 RepID=A0ABY7FZA7_MYAAR|nr:hypothetical protein MAR_013221 [Mya arenaria]